MHLHKKQSSFFLLLLLLAGFLMPLTTTGQNLYQGYQGLNLNLGYRSIRISPSTIDLSYYDESPLTDYVSTTRYLSASRTAFGFDLAWVKGEWDGFHGGIQLAGTFSQARRMAFEAIVGYNFAMSVPNLYLRPMVNLSLGWSTVSLGYMRNRSVYIQVNQTRFYEEYIDVDVSSFQLGLRPAVALVYQPWESFGIDAQLGFFLPVLTATPRIGFSGSDSEGNAISASESLSASNVYFHIDGVENRRRLPFKTGGPFINLGGTYYF